MRLKMLNNVQKKETAKTTIKEQYREDLEQH